MSRAFWRAAIWNLKYIRALLNDRTFISFDLNTTKLYLYVTFDTLDLKAEKYFLENNLLEMQETICTRSDFQMKHLVMWKYYINLL